MHSARSQQELPVVGEIDGPDGLMVSLDNLRVTLDSVVPKSDVSVGAGGGNHASRWSHFYIVNSSFVAHESEGSHGRFEVPNHHSSVLGS